MEEYEKATREERKKMYSKWEDDGRPEGSFVAYKNYVPEPEPEPEPKKITKPKHVHVHKKVVEEVVEEEPVVSEEELMAQRVADEKIKKRAELEAQLEALEK